jgi:N6-adenosine-specific RNA methylase IME4
MSISDLCRLPIKDICDKNSVLFLWTTSPLLEDSFKVIKAWGFKYKSSFVWDKVKHNMGHYNSVRHEFLLICTRGSFTPQKRKLHDSVISIPRTKHSEKPIVFAEIIDEIYHTGHRLEMFARRQRDGWDVFGNEVENSISLPNKEIVKP